VTLVWGDLDPIRSGEQNRSGDDDGSCEGKDLEGEDEMRGRRKHHNKGRVRVSQEWTSDHIQESEFMTYLRFNGVNCEGYEVQKVRGR
jgi:hypothetical protein